MWANRNEPCQAFRFAFRLWFPPHCTPERRSRSFLLRVYFWKVEVTFLWKLWSRTQCGLYLPWNVAWHQTEARISVWFSNFSRSLWEYQLVLRRITTFRRWPVETPREIKERISYSLHDVLHPVCPEGTRTCTCTCTYSYASLERSPRSSTHSATSIFHEALKATVMRGSRNWAAQNLIVSFNKCIPCRTKQVLHWHWVGHQMTDLVNHREDTNLPIGSKCFTLGQFLGVALLLSGTVKAQHLVCRRTWFWSHRSCEGFLLGPWITCKLGCLD